MRIRFVLLTAYNVGGTIRTTLSMAGALADRGHDVEVASVVRSADEPVFPTPANVTLTPLTGSRRNRPRGRPPGPRDLVGMGLGRLRSRLIHPDDIRYSRFSLETDIALRRYLRRQEDAVVLGTRSGLNLAVARYAPPSAIRIAQEHTHLGRQSERMREAFRDRYPALDALVTLTQGDADGYRTLLATVDGAGTRVQAIPNAVPDLGGLVRQEQATEARVVVAAGRLTKQKGFDFLIRAWVPIAARYPDWQLHIYGEGHLETELAAQIDSLGLGRQVRLMGFTSELPQRISEAALYVLCSRFEGFPMVLLEAMGCGAPVVAFDCPTGPADLIDDGVNGLIVPPRSIKGLTRAIIRAIENPDLRRELGKNARETSLAYSRPSIAKRWEDLFTQLADQRGLNTSP